ncbi:MAG: hypothetical protein ABIH90_01850, partial [Candidatus Aenigmatarchaeota archaeon]
ALAKIIIGFILLLVGLALLIDSPKVMPSLIPNGVLIFGDVDFGAIDWLGSLITIIIGFIPAFLILVGLFMVWLEADELKMQKELEKEEEKPKKGKK